SPLRSPFRWPPHWRTEVNRHVGGNQPYRLGVPIGLLSMSWAIVALDAAPAMAASTTSWTAAANMSTALRRNVGEVDGGCPAGGRRYPTRGRSRARGRRRRPRVPELRRPVRPHIQQLAGDRLDDGATWRRHRHAARRR